MADLYFRGTSKRALTTAGRALGFILPDAGEGIIFAPGVNVYVVSGLTLVPGVYNQDSDSTEITPPVDSAFVHANVRLSGVGAISDLVEGLDEDGFDTSKIRKQMRTDGVLVNVDSQRRVKTHSWLQHTFPNGDIVELIWPVPEFPRTGFL